MVGWSSPVLRSGLIPQLRKCSPLSKLNNVVMCRDVNGIQVRTLKTIDGVMQFVPSSFSRNKTKDLVKFYLTLTSLPLIGVILYANIFIGPATLKPIPEGYEPKHWEYHRHPISRFISKYLTENPQKTYEKLCFFWHYRVERKLLSELERKVKFLISDRRDFQAWYYTPGYTKYTKNRLRKIQDIEENSMESHGFPLY